MQRQIVRANAEIESACTGLRSLNACSNNLEKEVTSSSLSSVCPALKDAACAVEAGGDIVAGVIDIAGRASRIAAVDTVAFRILKNRKDFAAPAFHLHPAQDRLESNPWAAVNQRV